MVIIIFAISFISGIFYSAAIMAHSFLLYTLPLCGLLFAQILFKYLIKHSLLSEAAESRQENPIFRRVKDWLKLIAPRLSQMTLIALLSFYSGSLRHVLAFPEISPSHIAYYPNSSMPFNITGLVIEEPEHRDTYQQAVIQVETLEALDVGGIQQVDGRLLLNLSNYTVIGYGDRIAAEGYLETPPDDEAFSYKDYLQRKGIYAMMSFPKLRTLEKGQGKAWLDHIYALKESSRQLIARIYPSSEAALLTGILLGDDSYMSRELTQSFQKTGTSHIIAISGFNITIIAGLFTSFFSRFFGKQKGALIALLGIGLYTILVGADPPVVRAAIMGGLALFARRVGRQQEALISLSFTAAIMALINPFIIWDAGFQLSFMATLGLVIYAEPFSKQLESWLQKVFPENKIETISKIFSEYFMLTLAAQILIVPLLLYHFQQFSIIGLLANFLILPVQPLIMILGGLSLILGLILLPAGQIIAVFTWPLLRYTIQVVELFSKLEAGLVRVSQVGLGFIAVYFLVVFTISRWGGQLVQKLRLNVAPIILTLLSIGSLMVWQLLLHAPDGKLHVTFLNVGTGDAILIETPEGRFALLNGGPSGNQLSNQLGDWLPFFHQKLDWIIVASSDEHQIKALTSILPRYASSQLLWAGPLNASSSSRRLNQMATELQIQAIPAAEGQVLDLGGGATLSCFSVGSKGASYLLSWEDFSLYLPLGISFDEIKDLGDGKAIGPVTALLLANNGYAPLNPAEWIENLAPQFLILSVGAGNKQGLPSPELLDRMDAGSLLRTDRHGWVQLSTDGHELWIEVQQSPEMKKP